MSKEIYIPEAIKVMTNWVAWKLERRKDRMTKMPYQVNGQRASSTDRNTWNTFEAIKELLSIDSQYNGFGFMVSDGILFVDVDRCISVDGMDERGKDVLSAFTESYAEISQSGAGLHILTRGMIPRNFNNQRKGVEMYGTARFCAITGNALRNKDPAEEQDAIDYCFNRYCTRSGTAISTYSEPLPTGSSPHSDSWIIAHAMNIEGKRGSDFRTLFSGDFSAYGSQSEADEALCVLLAFWCDRDQGQIDRIFRQSGLYRKKWERQDYRVRTITSACNHIPESLSEWYIRHQREVKENASVMSFLNCGG